MFRPLVFFNTISAAIAGTILWDGRFNDMASSAAFEDWSWSDQTGPYQYYIHGSSNVTAYVNLDSTFKNPADTGSNQGVKITLDSTAYWNGQTMRRTELIPQTTAPIGAGMVYYHFSMMRSDTNAPSEFREHQIAFFESHFTEMKSGWMSGASGTSDSLLRWDVSSSTEWNTTWEAGVWHNVAYGIDFDAGTVAFYHSTGADDLTLTVPAVPCTASSNGADWHLGVLELPRDGYADADEDIYFSGVYVESGDLTTSVSGPGGSSAASSGSVSSSVTPASTLASVASSSTALAVSSSVISQTEAASPSTTSAAISSSVKLAASSSTAPVISATTTAAAVAISSTASSSSMPSATAEAAGEEDDCY